MGYSTRIQVIQRQKSAQWYVNLPAAVAGAMEFTKAEVVEWVIQDKSTLTLKRVEAAQAASPLPRKKKR